MNMSHDMCYKVIQSKDARFDGLFFTAVKSTGIYCRPICRVPAPKRENCVFYEYASEAEFYGYRPCLRCRPEMAPGYALSEQSSELVRMMMDYFEKFHYEPKLINSCSQYIGVSTRHMRRVFQETLGVSPQSYMMTKRLLNAKNLLTDTQLPITEIALIVGFGSVSRFNAAFKNKYDLTPKGVRGNNKSNVGSSDKDGIVIRLPYRPPYDWKLIMNFFKMRAIPGIEEVTDSGLYRRTLQINEQGKTYGGWIEINPQPEENLVIARISKSLEKVLLTVIKKIRIAFDLDALTINMSDELPEGIRLPGCFDAFEMSTRAILGQQITVKAARTLALRMADSLGTHISTPWENLSLHFPSANDIVVIDKQIEEVLGVLGIIKSRSNVIFTLAQGIVSGDISFDVRTNVTELKRKLLQIKGIGPWSAEYIVMRAMSYPDSFPVMDMGVKHALSKVLIDEEDVQFMTKSVGVSKYTLNKKYEKFALSYAEKFRPWRSYLTISLWQSLSEKSEL